MSHEGLRQQRKARAAMELMEHALAADGDAAMLIAGAAQPTGIRRLALDMLAVDGAAGEVFEPAARGRSGGMPD